MIVESFVPWPARSTMVSHTSRCVDWVERVGEYGSVPVDPLNARRVRVQLVVHHYGPYVNECDKVDEAWAAEVRLVSQSHAGWADAIVSATGTFKSEETALVWAAREAERRIVVLRSKLRCT